MKFIKWERAEPTWTLQITESERQVIQQALGNLTAKLNDAYFADPKKGMPRQDVEDLYRWVKDLPSSGPAPWLHD